MADYDYDAEQQWIENRIEQLINGECDPCKPQNFCDAIGDANGELMAKLKPLLENVPWDSKPENYAKIGEILCSYVDDYWSNKAEQKAEDDLEDEKDGYYSLMEEDEYYREYGY